MTTKVKQNGRSRTKRSKQTTARRKRETGGKDGTGREDGHSDRMQTMMASLAYASPLPFGVHYGGVLGYSPSREKVTVTVDDFLWDDEKCAIAETVLAQGYSLSVSVPAAFVASAAATLAQALPVKVLMGYDERAGKLIVWRWPAEEPEDEPQGGGSNGRGHACCYWHAQART